MQRRPLLAQHVVERPALLDLGADAVQALEVTLEREQDGLRALAGGERAIEFQERAVRLPTGRGERDLVERELGGVADDRLDVLDLDRAPAVA